MKYTIVHKLLIAVWHWAASTHRLALAKRVSRIIINRYA
jgi:hypothetical protein